MSLKVKSASKRSSLRASRLRDPLLLAAGLLGSGFAMNGCAMQEVPVHANLDPEFEPLSPLDPLLADQIDPESLPSEEGSSDEVYPRRFDLLDTQSPVRNQASRGVCSIFATMGYIESAYIKSGLIARPDFSEQALQWSTKVELGQFLGTEGSNNSINMNAASRFGVPLESAWPYETSRWTSFNDPACDAVGGDSLPVRCYTNGDAPSHAVVGPRYRVPNVRGFSAKRVSIMGYVGRTGLPVLVGGDFFYQAWSHGKSTLPTSADYKSRGIIQSPNAADRADSSGARRAGHAVLIVGWDQDMEVQRLNEQGQPEVDAQGRPVMEKGFFLIKNSWGTSGWGNRTTVTRADGTQQVMPGYGWISMKYVEEIWGQGYGGDAPTSLSGDEICDDQIDNDGDSIIDCLDTQCRESVACSDQYSSSRYSISAPISIPDGKPEGITQTFQAVGDGPVQAVAVLVNLQHNSLSELTLALEHNGKRVPVALSGWGDFYRTIPVTGFEGMEAKGAWNLVAIDRRTGNEGTLDGFHLDILRCSGEKCSITPPADYEEITIENTRSTRVLDNNPAGAVIELNATSGGDIRALALAITMQHAKPEQLSFSLQKVGETGWLPLTSSDPLTSATRNFSVNIPEGTTLRGRWRLWVIDAVRGAGGFVKNVRLTASAQR